MTTSVFTNPLATSRLPAPADPAANAHDDGDVAAERREPSTADEPAQRWTLAVHLAPCPRTSGPLKVLSVLHTRQVSVSHMQYVAAPDGSAVMTFECTTHVASIETVRKSVENAVVVTTASAHEAPPPPRPARSRSRRRHRGAGSGQAGEPR